MKSLFTENIGLKLIALALALSLEIYFYSPDNSVTDTATAIIEVTGLPAQMVVVEPPIDIETQYAKVRLRGPSQLIDQVKTSSLKLVVKAPPGIQSSFPAKLNADDLRLPSGVEVLHIEPKIINFRLERAVKRELTVVPNVVGEPAEGFQLSGVTLTPKTVLARGPHSELEGRQEIETQEINIEALKGTKRIDVTLDESLELTTFNVNVITVHLNIKAIESTRVLEKVPVKLVGAAGGAASLTPSSVKLNVSGPINLINRLEMGQVLLTVDATELSPGQHELPVTAELPLGISLDSSEPATVTVTLVADASKSTDSTLQRNEEEEGE